jgi:hypothetical protein
MVSDGLMYFFGVQTTVANQLSGEKQHRYFVTVTRSRRRVGIDIEHIDSERVGRRRGRQLAQHLLAQAASWPRIHSKARLRRRHGSAARHAGAAGKLHRVGNKLHRLGRYLADRGDLMALHDR